MIRSALFAAAVFVLGSSSAAPDSWMREGEGAAIERDPEDELLAAGRVPQLPMEVRVTDEPAGFVLFEKYANIGYGDSVTFVDAKRGVAFRKSLEDLYGPLAPGKFTASVSSIWPKGLLPEASSLAMDEAAPLSLRRRATVAARRAGGSTALESLFLKAEEKGNPAEVRKYAAAHLTEILGERVMPVLRRLMRGEADNDVWHPCQKAFVALGEKAVPTLCEMLLEEGESPDYRGSAAHALGSIRSPKAIDALLLATAAAEEYTANAALNAAIATGAPDLGPRLAKILERGSTQDSRIAMYFRENPAEYARVPLEKALERAEPDSFDERTIREALEALGR